ncbi:precorrin-6A reductase [Ectothiorhodosinus mongolicus]|uniref:Precorrin-6A reductase n=1 Tax=Ectothiorhodosinus mongolicus TaxID=233100 RepID=A0A1R3VWC2_9GAMM|nr:cobalt-precorrin-6A reductase [Ectothiorhodosinus mongolicus]ULX57002.1 cobalt-precorrin-6A reductase [Ectothiorhodosinus mongolicus]SIT69407.1 precorrin-6A reductase [Ectothiorhodosinus mongolicus]
MPGPVRILLLGGTQEARQIVEHLIPNSEYQGVYSLAGRTQSPQLPNWPVRQGGFGGIPGLIDYLRQQDIDLIIDATHPFAAQMSRHAVEAAATVGIAVLRVERPAWQPETADDWRCMNDWVSLIKALGAESRRVFLSIGRQHVGEFVAAPQHFYLLRSIEPPEQMPPNSLCLHDRGPFSLAEELELLKKHKIEVIVSKNSGGQATQAKLLAARELGLPVLMLNRPAMPPATAVAADAAAALSWLSAYKPPPTERGV